MIDLKKEGLVVFLGGPRHRILETLIRHQFKILLLVIPEPKNPKLDESIAIALSSGVPLLQLNKKELFKSNEKFKGKFCLSLGFPYLFPSQFLKEVRCCLNVHGTLLPKYRGACTLNWVIENGETESGVTVHWVDEGCDTGPILLQRSFPVTIFDTGKSLYRKTLEFEPAVVLEALELMMKGQAKPIPQSPLKVVQHPNRKPHHSELDPSQSLISLYNKIRASDPEHYPAYFFVEGEKICVKIYRENPVEDDLL